MWLHECVVCRLTNPTVILNSQYISNSFLTNTLNSAPHHTMLIYIPHLLVHVPILAIILQKVKSWYDAVFAIYTTISQQSFFFSFSPSHIEHHQHDICLAACDHKCTGVLSSKVILVSFISTFLSNLSATLWACFYRYYITGI